MVGRWVPTQGFRASDEVPNLWKYHVDDGRDTSAMTGLSQL